MSQDTIITTEIPDSGRVLDQDTNEWVNGWQNFFRIHKRVVFHDKVGLNVVDDIVSPVFNCSKYSSVGLACVADNNTAPTVDIFVSLQFSGDGVKFYNISQWQQGLYDTVPASYIYPGYSNGDPAAGYILMPYGTILTPQVFALPVVGEYCRVGIVPYNPILTQTFTVEGFFRS